MTDTAVRSVSLRARRLTACDWAFTVSADGPDDTFVWDFGDGQSAGTLEPSASHTYAGDGDRRVTATMISPAGPDRAGSVNIHVANCAGTAARQPPAAAERASSSRVSSELLVLATVLPLVAALLVAVGVGVGVSQLWVAGAVIATAGLVLLALWASSHRATTPALVTQTMRTLVLWIVALAAPVAAAVTVFFWRVDGDIETVAVHVLELALGATWLLAAIGKARTPGGARAAVERLIDGPPGTVAFVARVAVPVELVLAVMLFLRLQAQAAAITSVLLFSLFALGLSRLAVRSALGGDAGAATSGGCGCFGRPVDVAAKALRPVPADLDSRALPRAVARNLVFATLALAVALGA